MTLAVAGTRLYIATTLAPGSSSSEALEIIGMACPTGIDGIDENEQRLTLRDGATPSWAVGPRIPAPITIPFNFTPRSRSHQALIALRNARTQVSFLIAFGRSTPAPITTSGIRIVSGGATSAEFLGKVVAVSHGAQIGEIVRSQLVLARDGDVTWDFPTADLD